MQFVLRELTAVAPDSEGHRPRYIPAAVCKRRLKLGRKKRKGGQAKEEQKQKSRSKREGSEEGGRREGRGPRNREEGGRESRGAVATGSARKGCPQSWLDQCLGVVGWMRRGRMQISMCVGRFGVYLRMPLQ